MIIAKEKKKENIAEYLLYMYQVEDFIRANQLNIDLIKQNIISQFNLPSDVKNEMKIWYADLIEKMRTERIIKEGHFEFLLTLTEQLNSFHKTLLADTNELSYIELYNKTLPYIKELREISKVKNLILNDVEVCLHGLYGFLMLKLGKKTITQETTEAVGHFSALMGVISKKYKEQIDIETV